MKNILSFPFNSIKTNEGIPVIAGMEPGFKEVNIINLGAGNILLISEYAITFIKK
jgi:hypothetical protein